MWPISLTSTQKEKYQRQLSMSAFDEEKQENLFNSRALVIHGADSTLIAAEHLLFHGIGEIVFCSTENHKIKDPLEKSDINYDGKLSIGTWNGIDSLESTISEFDIVIESILDWQLKLAISDLVMRTRVPLIHSGAIGHRYQIYCMVPGKSACLRCVFPQVGLEDFPLGKVEPHPLLSVEAWAGALMSLEALKLVAGLGVTKTGSLWRLDALSGDIEPVRNLVPQADCPDCGF